MRLCWSVIANDDPPRVLLACLSYMPWGRGSAGIGAMALTICLRCGLTVVNILLYGFNLVLMGALLGGRRVLMAACGDVLPVVPS
jgi:hypothetical protein